MEGWETWLCPGVPCRVEREFHVAGIIFLCCQVSTCVLQGPEKGCQVLTCLLPLGLRLLFKSAGVSHLRHPPATTELSPVHLPPASYTYSIQRCQEHRPQ